jgi:DNA-binding transcriptional LysR family regulator
VMEYAGKILGLSDEMETRVGEVTGSMSGPLLLGASTTIAEFMLPQILGEFKARHPQVQARMTVANSETIENRVADYSIDLGLIESPSHLPALHTEVCCDDELVMICAPGHKLAKSSSVTPQQVILEPYVSRESGSGTREFADNYLRRCKVSPEDLNIVMELGSPEAIKGVVETGIGVSIVSHATIVKELKLGVLVAVPLRPRLIRTLSLVYPKEKFRSKLLGTFVEFATAKMKQMADAA